MIRFAVSTLGCKVNTYESQAYIQGLIDLGYQEVDFKEIADIYLINTCAVTNTASSKSRQKIHQANKQNHDALIVVVGCYVQTSSKEVLEIEGVDLILGSDGKSDLVNQIKHAYENKTKTNLVHEINTVRAFEALPIHQFYKHTRAFLKIQDGCNQFCSYCIIPYARGRERSLPPDEVIKIAKELIANQHREIVLSGIHTGRYGHDLETDLLSLLKRLLNEVDGLERIRISSIEMNELTEDFLLFMANEERIARHLHIPIQSGCDHILQLMNRPYKIAEFIEKIRRIRELMPTCSISSDIIVGFPGESEADFQETLENLAEIEFSFMHVFPYSKRDGTVAATLPEQINGLLKKERARKLNELSKIGYTKYQTTWLTQEAKVLFEKHENGFLMGHSSEYLPIIAQGSKDLVGKCVTVSVVKVETDQLIGTL